MLSFRRGSLDDQSVDDELLLELLQLLLRTLDLEELFVILGTSFVLQPDLVFFIHGDSPLFFDLLGSVGGCVSHKNEHIEFGFACVDVAI